jgi:hypothetical protein
MVERKGMPHETVLLCSGDGGHPNGTAQLVSADEDSLSVLDALGA